MIVKNEATVITRCLASVLPLIDYWVIVDTGSDDGTQDVIKDFMRFVPGELHERPWVDFAHNRSEALRLARPHGDYSLIIDADDTLVIDPKFELPLLDKDSYNVIIDNPPIVYHRPQLLRSRALWRYGGVLHEFPVCGRPGHTQGFLRGVRMRCGKDGARAKHPDRFRHDAEILERALLTESDPFLVSRYRFYLAQSYQDCGEREKAIENYEIRAGLGYWEEEVFVSLFRVGQLKERLGHPVDDILSAFRRASEACPRRAEALHAASRLCRAHERFADGYELASRGLKIPSPNGGLFVEPWIYDYGLLDELAINAYWIERYEESLAACERLLREGKVPAEMRGRIEQNGRFAREKISARYAAKTNVVSVPSSRPASSAPANPRVLLAILAKQKERVLPFYLLCIEALDYPKDAIVLHVRTNNNTDRTATILKEWISRVGDQYAAVEFDESDVAEPVQQFGVHEWNQLRFKVLGRLRYESMQRALQRGCDYYFVVDVDNFVKPNVLRDLISVDLPIVAPMLRHVDEKNPYSNFHEKIDRNGYFKNSEEYYWLLHRRVKGICQVPVVHCTYLVRADVIPKLSYDDRSGRWEYVIFSDSARKNGIPQYLDNREVQGYLTSNEDPRTAMTLLGPQIGARILSTKASAEPLIFVCCCQHGSGSTWMFNLAREICRTMAVNFVSCSQDSDAYLPWDALGSRLLIVKAHNPTAGLRSLIANADVPAIITVRDPRDAVASHLQRFPNSLAQNFDQALEAIAVSAERLVALSRLCQLPIFRYEDGFVGRNETFDKVAALLGVSPSEEQRVAILDGLSPSAVRETVAALEAAGAIRGEKMWDRETQWHAGHVGDGKIGKFKAVLTPSQQQEVLDRTREFYECFGYADTPTRRHMRG